ncbi:MAG TPA: tetratricopeptide repeat protein [Candidatus Solibacter sp.]|nr:tetratricopeptide repeat protein [Candidatus Solibacter sp.]
MKSRVLLTVVLLGCSAAAQLETGTKHRIRVRVAFSDGSCDRSLLVRLVGRSGPTLQSSADDRCEVTFPDVPDGTYHLNVSGQDFSATDDVVEISSGANEFEIAVKRGNEPDSGPMAGAGPAISASTLAIPAKAQKEFDKANGWIDRKDFPRAIDALKHAIALYPSYASAYNNLAVIYARQGDRAHERDALQEALRIDDHFAPAYVNLGRMDIAANDFPDAESAFKRAASSDPSDAMTYVLLSFTELMNRRFDEAINASKLAHLQKGSHAFAHQVAAKAFEQKRDGASAITELNLFLTEEPSGPRADSARKELAALQAIVH